MQPHRDPIREIAEMRSMMERSTKFLSLSGLSGVMAGLYALAGAYVVYAIVDFHPNVILDPTQTGVLTSGPVWNVILTGSVVLLLTLITAILLSSRKASRRGEKVWSPTSRRMMYHMAVPLLTGGILILILASRGLTGLMVPFSLMFYGLALYMAGQFTYGEIRSLGLLEIGLGLLCIWIIPLGIWCWAVGFGLLHVVYGLYMHYRYER